MLLHLDVNKCSLLQSKGHIYHIKRYQTLPRDKVNFHFLSTQTFFITQQMGSTKPSTTSQKKNSSSRDANGVEHNKGLTETNPEKRNGWPLVTQSALYFLTKTSPLGCQKKKVIVLF
ncbi:hypothetical protein JTE90_019559 [Oedothorax gibbosus]|uniref:Uncharacterized protein n=1 Tax=Oedothorax gibbosus TaxID=931172 RepID=A0AAV6V6E8_9ARAC|nr:hypothetical protein JTE90_019559 [Oedothorax gibbosus]